MTVSVAQAKKNLNELLSAVEKGERVAIERNGQIIAEIVSPSKKKAPKFGTLKGIVHMDPEQFTRLQAQ